MSEELPDPFLSLKNYYKHDLKPGGLYRHDFLQKIGLKPNWDSTARVINCVPQTGGTVYSNGDAPLGSFNSSREETVFKMLLTWGGTKKYRFLSSVPLADIFEVDEKKFKAHFDANPEDSEGREIETCLTEFKSHIGKKAVDILVCDATSGGIVGVVEVDGGEHVQKATQHNYDLSKNLAFLFFGVPVLRFSNGDLDQLKEEFKLQSQGVSENYCALVTCLLNHSLENWFQFEKLVREGKTYEEQVKAMHLHFSTNPSWPVPPAQ